MYAEDLSAFQWGGMSFANHLIIDRLSVQHLQLVRREISNRLKYLENVSNFANLVWRKGILKQNALFNIETHHLVG